MRRFILTLLLTTLVASSIDAQGYYKDIFMDSGIRLTSRKDLPAARRLGLTMERFISNVTNKLNMQDTILQDEIMIGNPLDFNGILLYPDGQPRYKILYTNGGSSLRHGQSLGEVGRDRVRQFYDNGGSFVGTCAGMFIASRGKVSNKYDPNIAYYHLWPHRTHNSGLKKTRTGHFIEPGSALLRYYDFGGDMHVAEVYHNNGGYAYEGEGGLPKGTEILARYDYNKPTNNDHNIHRRISTWAYKKDEQSGRLVVIGSHPESVTSGERLDLMSSLILYAIDGLGTPVIKGELKRGETRVMDKDTPDEDPAYTKIGDKQYHHFTVEIPEGAKDIVVELVGANGYDLNLFMRKDGPAFINEASIVNITKGAEKSIEAESLEAGTWYVAVECDTTVEVTETQWGDAYTGNLSVLNGVPYQITVNWK